MMMKKTLLATALLATLMSTLTPSLHAQAVQATGRAEVEVKQFKDQIAARAAARKMAERDAIRSALKLRLNIDASGPGVDAKIDDIVKDLSESLRSTFRTEGDVLTATAQLNVDATQLTDISRSLGLQNSNVMESASILFLVDEYWGVATNLDPSQPLVSEVEYFHDKSSTSDTSAKSASSSFSDTSSKVAASSNSASSFAGSSKQSASLAASERTSVAASRSASIAGTDNRALAAQDGAGGSLAAARSSSGQVHRGNPLPAPLPAAWPPAGVRTPGWRERSAPPAHLHPTKKTSVPNSTPRTRKTSRRKTMWSASRPSRCSRT
jgi:hypothetical protein